MLGHGRPARRHPLQAAAGPGQGARAAGRAGRCGHASRRLAHALAGGGGASEQAAAGARGWLGFGILLIAAAFFGYQQWQLYQQTREIEELDVADPDVGPADRRLRRPRLPDLAHELPAVIAAALADPRAVARLSPSAPSAAHAQITMGSPSWSQLSPQERQVLAPLAPDWNNLDAQRKQKWRGIAQRYPNMGLEEQQTDPAADEVRGPSSRRSSGRRRASSTSRCGSCRPTRRTRSRQRWQEYQSLPPDQKRELAADAPRRRRGAHAGAADDASAVAGSPATAAPSDRPSARVAPPRGDAAPSLSRRDRRWPASRAASRRSSTSCCCWSRSSSPRTSCCCRSSRRAPRQRRWRCPSCRSASRCSASLFAVLAAYFVWCWSNGRRTLAMKTWRLRARAARAARRCRRRPRCCATSPRGSGPRSRSLHTRRCRATDSARTRRGSSRSTSCGRSSTATGCSCTTASRARGSS